MDSRGMVLAFGLALGACDPSPDADFFAQPRRLSHVDVVAAFPARRAADGHWARACDDASADGLLLAMAFVSTMPSGVAPDRDLAIRPGDVLGGGPMVAPAVDTGLAVTLACRTAVGGDGACEAIAGALETLRFEARTPAREVGHDLILLIDDSGSIDGLVDAAHGDREVDPTTLTPPANAGSLASDRADLRLTAARTFVASLGPDDRICVLAFGEGLGAGGVAAVSDAAATCFADLAATLPGVTLAGLGAAAGRSPLWAAVDAAVSVFDGVPTSSRSRDLVVITDGPDTCAPGAELDACAAPCSAVTAGDVRTRLASHPELRLHLVQFEAKGYRGPDPRQVAAACESGGHFRFVNSEDFGGEWVALQESLDQALLGVRFALMGEWQAGLALDPAEPGALHGLSGVVHVRPPSRLVGSDRDFPFGRGMGFGAVSAPAWDRSPLVLTPCTGAAASGAADADCDSDRAMSRCDLETRLCAGPAAPPGACDDE